MLLASYFCRGAFWIFKRSLHPGCCLIPGMSVQQRLLSILSSGIRAEVFFQLLKGPSFSWVCDQTWMLHAGKRCVLELWYRKVSCLRLAEFVASKQELLFAEGAQCTRAPHGSPARVDNGRDLLLLLGCFFLLFESLTPNFRESRGWASFCRHAPDIPKG